MKETIGYKRVGKIEQDKMVRCRLLKHSDTEKKTLVLFFGLNTG
jgi:hypothetical protein